MGKAMLKKCDAMRRPDAKQTPAVAGLEIRWSQLDGYQSTAFIRDGRYDTPWSSITEFGFPRARRTSIMEAT